MTPRTVALRGERLAAAALGAADWVCFAAAPTFAIMALLAGVLGDGAQNTVCSAAQDASPLSGMVWLHMLMSAFHSAPWLKLISSRPKTAPAPPVLRMRAVRSARSRNNGAATAFDRQHAVGEVRVAGSARTIRTREHERNKAGGQRTTKDISEWTHLRSCAGRRALTDAVDMSRGHVFPENTGEGANGEDDDRRHEK
jgi:hypothetical protein